MARQWLRFGPLAGTISVVIVIISTSASAQETPQSLRTASEQITNGLIVAVDEPVWAAACNAETSRLCTAELPVVFTNRGPAPVRIERFEVVRMEGVDPLSHVEATVRVHQPTPRRIRIAPTASLQVRVRNVPDTEKPLVVRVVLHGEGAVSSRSFVLSNPARLAAREACTAQRGLWGAHGKSQRLHCIPRTHDGGKECHDGADCEGLCLYERHEIVQQTRCMGCKNWSLGRPKGRCSEFAQVFGCVDVVGNGQGRKPPVKLPAKPERMCRD